MKAEDLLLFGGLGLAVYLMVQSVSSAADTVPNVASEIGSGFKSAAQAIAAPFQAAAQTLTAPIQMVAAVPSMWSCGDAAMASYMPGGTGALTVPDSYVIPCAGGVTAGMIRASGASDAELINYIAAVECACSKAQMPGSGATVQGNVIVPSSGVSGYRLPAGVVRA